MEFAERTLEFTAPKVMGVLNVTPDSFSDGGNFNSVKNALSQAQKMVAQGASIIDVGGESTRPGAADVSVQEELDRVIPVIEAISGALDVIVSVDTSKPEVMRQAVHAGAALINDVRALQEDGALSAAKELGVPVCLMHMQGQPREMQASPEYGDVVKEVVQFLLSRVSACEKEGIPREKIILDPGFGFGKTLEHNLKLFRALESIVQLNFPLLVGVSRKSMLGSITGKPVGERLAASVAAAAVAAFKGASILRVHDVDETVDALKLIQMLRD